MTETAASRLRAREGVMFREIARESVLLNLDREAYFGLDDVGTRMWNVLVGAPSIAAAFEVLAQEYEVDPDTLRADLAAFIERLAEAGLVAVDDA